MKRGKRKSLKIAYLAWPLGSASACPWCGSSPAICWGCGQSPSSRTSSIYYENHSIIQITCLRTSGLFNICLISGFLSITSCIWGLDSNICLITSGLLIKLWVRGLSNTWYFLYKFCSSELHFTCLNISGLLIKSLCILCCISMKLADPIPRFPMPGIPPKPPIPKGDWEISGGAVPGAGVAVELAG